MWAWFVTSTGAERYFVTAADTAAVRISVIESPVHDREGLPGIRTEQQYGGEVGWNAASRVARIEANELQSHSGFGHGRHDTKVAACTLRPSISPDT